MSPTHPRRLLFSNAHVYGPVDDWQPGWLLTEGQRIHLMGPGQPPPFPEGFVSQQIDATGRILLPGFMDLHVHGAMGHDTMDASPEGLRAMAQFYARHGVKEYWIVDPDDGTIEVQRLQGTVFSTLALYEQGQILTTPTFEGLGVDVGQVFAE